MILKQRATKSVMTNKLHPFFQPTSLVDRTEKKSARIESLHDPSNFDDPFQMSENGAQLRMKAAQIKRSSSKRKSLA